MPIELATRPTTRVLRRACVGLLVAVAAASSRSADGGTDPVEAACPGAAAWLTAHADQSVAAMKRRDAASTLSRPALLAELERRVAADQAARRAMLAHPGDDALARAVNRVDAGDDEWLVALFKKDGGVPEADQIGEFGLHLTWVLVQHADRDPDLQKIALLAFARRYETSAFSADDLAKLTDRVLLAQGKPQRYGTQFDWASRKFDPRDVDIDGVDDHRRRLGLMPLSDHACVMNRGLRRLAP